MLLGFIAGLFGLGLLDAAVTSPQEGSTTVAASGVASGFSWLSSFVAKLVDPSVPAIADHSSQSSSSASSSSKSTTPLVNPPT